MPLHDERLHEVKGQEPDQPAGEGEREYEHGIEPEGGAAAVPQMDQVCDQIEGIWREEEPKRPEVPFTFLPPIK